MLEITFSLFSSMRLRIRKKTKNKNKKNPLSFMHLLSITFRHVFPTLCVTFQNLLRTPISFVMRHTQLNICTCTEVCMCDVCASVCVYIYICIYICMYAYIFYIIHIFYIYIIYIHIHIYQKVLKD